ncbi:SpaA isopeptide-forming pilin-related protein [Streptomyces sp. N35]|uniref:SpaA isopeptide-forming pilin-related protein n=1 Tax=Streptomyces sp. N35 TaxID=2795730 RepID=UPI0018F7776B|nr:SpaA isopeptide-forming pilin-related protein [Streptomyces sp. N35]
MGVLLAPGAIAADGSDAKTVPGVLSDTFGPGMRIPDSDGNPGASHIGGYIKVPNLPATKVLYCADPLDLGPDASGGYKPEKLHTSWTSRMTGKQVPTVNVMRVSYVLYKYGQTTSDAQAAAVDAATYTYLNPGTEYALPNGKRALERLSYPNVPAEVKTKANAYMQEAAKFAGPYKVNVTPKTPTSGLKPGSKVEAEVTVTSASGTKVPNVALDYTWSNTAGAEGETTTGADGVAKAVLTVKDPGAASIKATAKNLPSTALTAVEPNDSKAQRMLVVGQSAIATGQTGFQVDALKGGVKVVKTASDTNKPLAGVEFEVKDKTGKTVASGKTDAKGQWSVVSLAPGEYTVHEVKAVDGFQLAPDQKVTVTDGKTTEAKVVDEKIPEQPKPKPRPVTIPVLPKTGI